MGGAGSDRAGSVFILSQHDIPASAAMSLQQSQASAANAAPALKAKIAPAAASRFEVFIVALLVDHEADGTGHFVTIGAFRRPSGGV